MELLRNKIILVAAADAGSRDAAAAEFSRLGSQVLSVTGGIEAYELARERHVDAVITAARLSSGEPSLLLRDIRRLNHEVPVILFGAAGESISQTEALHQGFAGFFLQAFPSVELTEATLRSLEFVEERKKKKVERVAVAAQVDLTFGDPPTTVTVHAPVLNLSRGGMFLSMERSFPPLHGNVHFNLAFPPEIPQPKIEGIAFVRWVRERSGNGLLSGVGLEFREITEQAQSFLDSYVERTSAKK